MPLLKPTIGDLPLLIEMLEDPNPVYRADAAKSLLGLGGQARRAVPALSRIIVEDPIPGVREAAIQALSLMGKDAKGALDALVRATRDESPVCRRLAVHALSHIDSSSRAAAGAVAESMVDPDEGVRLAASAVIHRMNR